MPTIARRLEPYYPVVYKGKTGLVAHECILDLRSLKKSAEVDDIAKRLVDYGFHVRRFLAGGGYNHGGTQVNRRKSWIVL